MSEELHIQVYGDSNLPTLIYLPGLHGDWTAFTAFRPAAVGNLRIAVVTYARNTTATIEDYANEINLKLLNFGINSGWLLGESFGSQVAWALLKINTLHGVRDADSFQPLGLILAGGLVKHPWMWVMTTLRQVGGTIPMPLYNLVFRLFGLYLKLLHWRTPDVCASITEFVKRRTEFDREVMRHRLWLLEHYDPRPVARQTRLPVYYLGGFFDPLVPVFLVKRWLRMNCPGFKGGNILGLADHIVLYSASKHSSILVRKWMNAALS